MVWEFNFIIPCTHFFWELSVFPGPHVGGGGATQDLLLAAGINPRLHLHFFLKRNPLQAAPLIPTQAFLLLPVHLSPTLAEEYKYSFVTFMNWIKRHAVCCIHENLVQLQNGRQCTTADIQVFIQQGFLL